jgi:hypothetical protein
MREGFEERENHGDGCSCCRDLRFRGNEGRESSSTSSPFGGVEAPRDALNIRDTNLRVPFGGFPVLASVMVATDHGPVGSAAAFFNESMRCVATIGTKIGCILCMRYNKYRLLGGRFSARREKNLHSGRALNVLLKICTR